MGQQPPPLPLQVGGRSARASLISPLGVHSQLCLLDWVLFSWKHKLFLMVSFLSTRPKKHPVFLVDLVLEKKGVRYCTPLENFQTTVIELMDMGIQNTYNVPQLEKVK